MEWYIWAIIVVAVVGIFYFLTRKKNNSNSESTGLMSRARNIMNFGCKKTNSGWRI